MFIDRVKLSVKAGDGGNGIVAFRREKYISLGGPAGGDGGNGGSIIFEADSNKSTLLDLRYNKKIKAANGENGKNKGMNGRNAEDYILKVPTGTCVKDSLTGALIADLTRHGQRAIIAQGGKGGRGNKHFATPRNSAPEYAEHGGFGEDKDIEVELKILADAGLVGFPSVGKSTLLSVVSAARPEIAAYHFTTLTPNLGMVRVDKERSFVLADLPGLIEGASEGKGLGHQFLRHIERCRVIVHVVDMGSDEGRDPVEDYRVINEELEKYQYRLMERPQVVIANKMDLDEAETNLARFKEAYPEAEVFPICAITHEGVQDALYRVMELVQTTPEFPLTSDEGIEEGVLYKFEEKGPDFTITNLGNHTWKVEGDKIIRIFRSTDFNNEAAIQYFARVMRVMGIDQALRDQGAVDNDIILIDNAEFLFVE
ncbi:MAG: GTPase ObgE [Erysipelotrichales bacterium]|nr:GTPase ObgE [Erysipelotrichales bacterium]